MTKNYSERELADALTFLQAQTGFGNQRPQSRQSTSRQPQRNVPFLPGNFAQPSPAETSDLDVLTDMVQTIEANLRPEGVEDLWLMLGQLVFRRQRVNRFELMKGIGFYTLAFCMPWLAMKAVAFPKAIAGTAFMLTVKLVLPIATVVFLVALVLLYRKPLMLIHVCEVILGFMVSLIIFSLL